MLARVDCAAVVGIQAFPVEVEVDLQPSIPSFSVVGLPDEAVRESRDRVRAAVVNSGITFPSGRATVNLAPADLRKEGSGFDLAIAVGLLAAAGLTPAPPPGELLLMGELSLDGGLKPVRGALSVAMAAREAGFRGVVLPPANAPEAALVRGVDVYPAATLGAVVAWLRDGEVIEPCAAAATPEAGDGEGPDLRDVQGQEVARRVLEVAAAGGHNLLFSGPPGAGKTMLAMRLPGILPPMSFEESLETTRVHSVAGTLPPGRALVQERPFRTPHHTISYAGLIGGGARPRPGEVSLAHHGVLFLDELPEFSRHVLEVLRQPLETGEVTISRAALSLTYPAAFMLAAAMNPCPCGFLGDAVRACGCTARQVERYRGKISGPLLDRIDLHCEVPALAWRELDGRGAGEGSDAVRARVLGAREAQRRRFAGNGTACNARMSAKEVRRHCRVGDGGGRLLEQAVDTLGLSARGCHKVLKVARTVADLAGAGTIGRDHIAEAIHYRNLNN